MKRLILFFCLILTACTTTQQATDVQSPPVQDAPVRLLVDPKVRKGVLDNGLQFIVRENSKPENRAEIRLVVGVGSIVEDKDQQGLAHFVEHMAFNGTQHFPKQELIDYLESMGMQFGADTNAYTTFDETVYMLQVPTDSTALVETAFQILEDWAHQVSFEGEEIDKERGVVIEEWRGDRGADARMRDKQYPILLKDSQYAKRLSIGKKAVLDTFRHKTLRRFYKDWYRPDLMSVIAVGDFDGAQIERLIRDTFPRIPWAVNPRPRKIYPVPDHGETLFAIVSDPEAARSRVIVYYKLPVSSTV